MFKKAIAGLLVFFIVFQTQNTFALVSNKKLYDDLSVFISNFIEAPVSDFRNLPTEKDLIKYAIMHNYVNAIHVEFDSRRTGWIKQSDVDATCLKYFNIKPLKHMDIKDVADYYPDKKSYYVYLTTGAVYGFAKALTVEITCSTYHIYGKAYNVTDRVMKRSDIIQELNTIKKKFHIYNERSFSAEVKKVNGKYILIMYKEKSETPPTNVRTTTGNTVKAPALTEQTAVSLIKAKLTSYGFFDYFKNPQITVSKITFSGSGGDVAKVNVRLEVTSTKESSYQGETAGLSEIMIIGYVKKNTRAVKQGIVNFRYKNGKWNIEN